MSRKSVCLSLTLIFYSFPVFGEMYLCKRADGGTVFRNTACSLEELTVSVNGMSPEEWQRRSYDKYIADARAREKEIAEAARQATQAAKTGGLVDTVKNIAEAGALGVRAIVDPMGTAKAMAGKN